MYVKPNTPVLPLEPNTPAPKDAAELAAVIAWFWTYARFDAEDISCLAAAQAAASLELVRFFGWAQPTPVHRTLRRQMKTLSRTTLRAYMRGIVLCACALMFGACGDVRTQRDAGETLEPDAGDSEQDSAPPLELDGASSEPECGQLSDNLFGADLRALRGPACPGLALSSPGGDTRIVVDPRTQLCTFPCEQEMPTGRPECHDAHAAHVTAFCASLGGTCVADGDGTRCVYWREVGR